MAEKICPKCNGKLNIDEVASGRCFSCGEKFETEFTKSPAKGITHNVPISSTIGDNGSKNAKMRIVPKGNVNTLLITKVIYTLAIITFIGSIIIFLSAEEYEKTIALLECVAGCVSSVFIWGIGKIIDLLNIIAHQSYDIN